MYDELGKKLNNIDTSRFVLKTNLYADKSDLKKEIKDAEKKFPILADLLKRTDYNFEISEIENKITDVSSLIKKTDYNSKVSDIESKYITKNDCNKSTKVIVTNVIKSKNLLISEFISKADLDKQFERLATKDELKAEEDKIIKLQAFDSSYFGGKNFFGDDGS